MPGQNTHRPCSPPDVRPGSTSSTGRKVSAASSADTMPTAATGPRPRVGPMSASSRQSSPSTTVTALAATGSRVCRQARRIAS